MDALSRLPVELINQITSYLEHKGLVNLSAVNSQFRGILVSTIFRTIRFDNQTKNEKIIERVVTQYGVYADKLCLELYLPREDCADENAAAAATGIQMSSLCARLLSGERMPDIFNLAINFIPKEYLGGDGDEDGQADDADPDPCWAELHQVGGGELGLLYRDLDCYPNKFANTSWMQTMDRMWLMLQQNRRLASLEVVNMPVLPMASWVDSAWAKFLGRLSKRVVICIAGQGIPFQHLRAYIAYRDFFRNMDQYFFNHMTALEELFFIADQKNPYSDSEFHGMRIALTPQHMSRLHVATFRNCLIDMHCVRFLITACSRSLHSLRLVGCAVSANDHTSTDIASWAEVFSRISARYSMTLKKLVIMENHISLPDDWVPPARLGSSVEGTIRTDEWHGTVWSAMDTLLPSQNLCLHGINDDYDDDHVEGKNPSELRSRPFAYSYDDTMYAFSGDDSERVVQEWARGEDFVAYTKLMRRIRLNNNKSEQDNKVTKANDEASTCLALR
jgi:hypothetical protein